MPSARKKIVNGALLGAAATALTVKGALAGALGPVAQQPLDHLQKKLGSQASQALDGSREVIDRAQGQLEAAIARTAGGEIRLPATTGVGQALANRGIVTTSPRPSAAGQNEPAIEQRNEHSDRQTRMRSILRQAALRHGLDPKLILALSYWESGWDQSRVSSNDAVGLMQVEPYVAQGAGPALLGRPVDINSPYDNADLGAAIFREDLDNFGSPAAALAAYYQGPDSLRQNGMFPDTEQYVDGILALAAQMNGE